MSEPSTSGGNTCQEDDLSFMASYVKQDVTDALKVCANTLESLKICEGTPSDVITNNKVILLGKTMAEACIDVMKDFDFYEDYHLFLPEEEVSSDKSEEPIICDSSPEEEDTSNTCSFSTLASSQPESDYEPESKKQKIMDYIPLKTKIKIVNMVRGHPKWSLKTIHERGGRAFKSRSQLTRWCQEIERGGGNKEKYEMINKWTLDRFRKARTEKKPVTTRMLREWASQAAVQFENFQFVESVTWVTKWKLIFKIRQRKVTRYIKSRNALDIPTILSEAEKFQKRIAKQIVKFQKDFVINTGQTGCEYRADVRRILSNKGEKTTEVFLGDFNKLTHSYTAQYAITASGKVLPKIFLCMQEPKGTFGPRVSATIKNTSEIYGNIHVTASKSGKLTKAHFCEFVDHIIKPYCNREEFLLILDSWGGETDTAHFNSVFTDNEGNCTSMVEIIPPHCTPYCQPCDVYFFRQVKNFIKKIQNSVEVLQSNCSRARRF
ncbi:pogo transposable element with krab domain [Lasius niger]|uniref:Pogo transposable element with krab domain n=1 Tax=Lasius niger TaxID=67767 RepID=A0A0J7KDZ5_LASNI|nr:pogo transposable element with krab domain [Lasius niger]